MGPFYAFLSVLLFIVSHSQVKVLSHLPVSQVVLIRALGILIFSMPLMCILKIPVLGVDKRNLFLRGAVGSVSIFCYFTTLQTLPLPNAVVLAQLAPFFAVFFAGFLLEEKSGVIVYSLFALALIGVYLIKDPDLSFSWLYIVGVVGAALAALAYNFVRSLRKTDHPLVVLSWFQFVLVPVSFLGLFLQGYVAPQQKDFLAMVLLALFSFLAQVCLTLAYQKAVMSKASSVNFLSIPLSVVVAYYFFGEELKNSQFIGITVVFTAVLLNTVFRESLESFFQKSTSKS